jgi:hypothetical protein
MVELFCAIILLVFAFSCVCALFECGFWGIVCGIILLCYIVYKMFFDK